MSLHIVILAAGQGKRMNSARPKVLQPLGDRPLLRHVVETAQALDPAATAGTKMYGSGMGLMLNNVPNDLAKALRRQMKLITKSLAVWRPSVPDDS